MQLEISRRRRLIYRARAPYFAFLQDCSLIGWIPPRPAREGLWRARVWLIVKLWAITNKEKIVADKCKLFPNFRLPIAKWGLANTVDYRVRVSKVHRERHTCVCNTILPKVANSSQQSCCNWSYSTFWADGGGTGVVEVECRRPGVSPSYSLGAQTHPEYLEWPGSREIQENPCSFQGMRVYLTLSGQLSQTSENYTNCAVFTNCRTMRI